MAAKRQYRSQFQIAADIIEIAMNGSRKTRIMYHGNLSFDLLQKYLDMLLSFGLIEIQDGEQQAYIATAKGREFLEDFNELRKYSQLAESKRRELERYLTLRPESC
jgi:predicted transcriptional regulator